MLHLNYTSNCFVLWILSDLFYLILRSAFWVLHDSLLLITRGQVIMEAKNTEDLDVLEKIVREKETQDGNNTDSGKSLIVWDQFALSEVSLNSQK